MPPRAPSARLAARQRREGATENWPDGAVANGDAEGQVADLPDENLRNETLASDRDDGTGLRPSSDPEGSIGILPEENLDTNPALQELDSDLDALESTERDKLKRVEKTVELLKRINFKLEATGQERYLAELPLSRISHRLLQAHAGLTEDRDTLERFTKAQTFLVRQMPYWKQFVFADQGSSQRPRRVRGWEALNQTLRDIREGLNVVHESVRNENGRAESVRKRTESVVKGAQSDWNRMKFDSINSLLVAMSATYSRYFEKEVMDDEYIKFVVHNLTCLQPDSIAELEQLRLKMISLHEAYGTEGHLEAEVPTKESLVDLVRSFNSPERQIDLATEIVNLLKEPHDFVTATQPSDVKLMDRIDQLDILLTRLWDRNPKSNTGFDEFLRSLPPADETLIQSPLRMVEQLMSSWKIVDRIAEGTFVSLKQKLEALVSRTPKKYPRHLTPAMNYPAKLLRNLLVSSGAKGAIDAYAEHFRQNQVARVSNRAVSKGLTVAVASHTDTSSAVEDAYLDDDDVSHSLLEAIHAVQLKGEDVPVELMAALSTLTCDVCGEKGHLQAQCPMAADLRRKIYELLQNQPFANHSADTLSRFFATFFREKSIPFPRKPGYHRWNAANFRGKRGDTAN
jgi:hypothetical protein